MRISGFFLLVGIAALLFTGCKQIEFGTKVPDNFPRLIAFQLGDVSRVLILPIRDGGSSLDVAEPIIASAPFRELTRRATAQGGSFDRLLLLTSDGTVYSAIIGERDSTPVPTFTPFYRMKLSSAQKEQLLALWSKTGESAEKNDGVTSVEFDISESAAIWQIPGDAPEDAPKTAIRHGSESAWKSAIRFLEPMEPTDDAEPSAFRFYDRAAGMHGVYCPAERSHTKPDYAPNSILTLEYAKDQPVRIDGKVEFSDMDELEDAISVHLSSGRYALLKLKLADHKDIFPLDRSEIGELLRKQSEYYGSDFVIEMPDQTTIWYCSRCFSPE